MKQFLTLSSFLFISIALMYGQDSAITISKTKYNYTDIGVGFFKADLRSVNTSLKQFGYRPIKDGFVTLSISNSYSIKRFFIRTEFTYLFPNKTKQDNNVTTRFSGHHLTAGIGYGIIQKPNFILYPYIGLTSFYSKLKFIDNAPVRNMNEVINTPHRSSEISFGNAGLDIGIQVQKLFETENDAYDCPQINRWGTVGLRIGYQFGLKLKGLYNKDKVSDGPSFSMQGPYMKVTFGFGTKLRRLKWKK
jgi:hypothetical protein